MAIAVQDVEELSSTGWQNLDNSTKEALLDDAKRERNTVYSDRTSAHPTLDGDENVFIKNLAAHKFELASGGEATSESKSGGSVSYNTVTGDAIDELQTTRFGRVALKHLGGSQSTGIVRTW